MPLVANTITIEPSDTHERADRKGKKCTAMQKSQSPVVARTGTQMSNSLMGVGHTEPAPTTAPSIGCLIALSLWMKLN
jgi:hypothetical protein